MTEKPINFNFKIIDHLLESSDGKFVNRTEKYLSIFPLLTILIEGKELFKFSYSCSAMFYECVSDKR